MSHHDYQIAAEPDSSGRVNRQIWLYFIALALILAGTIGGLHVMYLFQVDYEKQRKIGEISTQEARDAQVAAANYVSGQKGLFEGKRHVSIDEAMARFLTDFRKSKE